MKGNTMPLFYPSIAADGTEILLNASAVLAFKRSPTKGQTLAICQGNVVLELGVTLERCADDIAALDEEEIE